MENKIYSFYVLTSSISPTEIRYVGVTTLLLRKRFALHKYCARHSEKRGLPVHKWMYSVYKAGGTINIEKIDLCSEPEWEEKEQNLILKYKDLGYSLLNLDKGGKGVVTKEMRSKSSILRSVDAHKKIVTAYTLDGKKFKEFSSLTEASNQLHISITNIESALSNNTKSAGGYMWVYGNLDCCISKYYKKQIGTKLYQFDLNGKLLNIFESKAKALNYINVTNHKALDKAIANRTIYKESYWSTNSSININYYESPFKYKIIKGNKTIKVREQKLIADIIGTCRATVCAKLKNSLNFRYNEYFIETL